MLSHVLKRLLQTVPTFLLVAVLVFLLVHVLPGSPVDSLADEDATAEEIAVIEARYGLDRPLFVQFLDWLAGLFSGDFGMSYATAQPVGEMIAIAAPPTVLLAFGALFVSVIVGIPLAVTAAMHQGRIVDRLVLMGSLLGISVPIFILGLGLMLIFAVGLRWFPASGFVPPSQSVLGTFASLVLPSVSLGLMYAANLARIGRAATLEVLSQEYVTTARALGLREWSIRYRHVLKNALNPMVTVIGIALGSLLGGTVVTERVFNLPGIGTLVINAIARRDYPVIQTAVLLMAGVYLAVNLLVDLAYSSLDPRVRLSESSGVS